MPTYLEAGPYRMIELDNGSHAPWYIIPFDKKGRCDGPATRDHLLETARQSDPAECFTDVFLFCHGWNNDWQCASGRYNEFLAGLQELRRQQQLPEPRPYRPLLIGLFWPSTALVLPWEKAPRFADTSASEAEASDWQVAQERQEVQDLAEDLPDRDVEAFYALVQREDSLDRAAALELARMLAPCYRGGEAEDAATETAASAEELLEVWETVAQAETPKQPGTGRSTRRRASAATSLLGWLKPREIVRGATVWKMKDRAGKVGARGVTPLLIDLLTAAPTARLHLVGHSYGCKVLLSAMCYRELPRPVNSVLLLQPAISHLCFADAASRSGQPGGYRAALDRVEQPILTTYSAHDGPLTKAFHLTVRRRSDLGEFRIAAPGTPPNAYAALGGFGPRGCEDRCENTDLKRAPHYYDLGQDGVRVLSLNGDEYISGHGDVSNEATWWALYNQVAWKRVPRVPPKEST